MGCLLRSFLKSFVGVLYLEVELTLAITPQKPLNISASKGYLKQRVF
jgi:hypothetical protein